MNEQEELVALRERVKELEAELPAIRKMVDDGMAENALLRELEKAGARHGLAMGGCEDCGGCLRCDPDALRARFALDDHRGGK